MQSALGNMVSDAAEVDIPRLLREQQNLIAEIAELRAMNASDHEIAIAVGIPDDSPLLIK